MISFLLLVFGALWLGILTSISPCPLATNIAAISFVSRKSEKIRLVFYSGLSYALGRMIVYALLSFLIVKSILSMPVLSFFLQKYMYLILGPLLIVVSMFLLELITISLPSLNSILNRSFLQDKLKCSGILGALFLGFLFALTFCPISAALFFGSLIPLAIKNDSFLMLSLSYGFGTALPVIVFSFALAGGSKLAADLFNKVTILEKWTRILTGIIILIIGIYFCLTYIFKI